MPGPRIGRPARSSGGGPRLSRRPWGSRSASGGSGPVPARTAAAGAVPGAPGTAHRPSSSRAVVGRRGPVGVAAAGAGDAGRPVDGAA
ncbi:hypothetical protein PZ61_0235475 [Streptomyces sp. MNU77]|nr:hypothetical protein PZ61_0235475 [Streptomyces sp. MNU77]